MISINQSSKNNSDDDDDSKNITDRTLTDITTPGQSGPGSNFNEAVICPCLPEFQN